ncbi:MAG: TRL domain-containing protein [Candidatus Binatia bacterium]
MIKHLRLMAAGARLFAMGCQPVPSPVIGLIYLDAKGPIAATQATGTKEGKACAQTVLGLIATGDASIEAAKRTGSKGSFFR